MVKFDLPYLIRIRSKGKTYWYYRRDGRRIRIKADPGTVEFAQAYEQIHASFEHLPEDDKGYSIPGSFAALILAYKNSAEFQQLKPKTRYDYTRFLDKIIKDMGTKPVNRFERRHVLAYRDRFADRPRTANFMVQMLRLILSWGLDRGWIRVNPALKPKQLKTGDGHRPWEEHELKTFRDTWAKDTVERVIFEILLNTGQRGGDVHAMTRKQAMNDQIAVAQEKTSERVWIPQSRDLKAVLKPYLASHDNLVLLVTKNGRPFGIHHFRHIMRKAVLKANLDGCTLHGLRYTAATILDELGCDVATIQAITGHRTEEMAKKYSAKKRRAKVAIARLDEARKRARKKPR